MSNFKKENFIMKRSFYFLSIISLFCLNNNLFPQKALTLNDAIQIALNKNVNVVKSTNSISSFQSSLKSAYGNLLPNLSVGGGFNWQRITNSHGAVVLDTLGRVISTGSSENDYRNWSLSAGGNVTLFNGLANLAAISQSKNNLESAKLTLEKLKQDVTLQTITYYTQIISNNELLNFQEENLKYNEELLKEIKEKFDLKMVAITDVYSQEAQTANTKVSYLQAKNNLAIAKINLLNYLAMDVSQNYLFDSIATSTKDSTLFNSSPENLFDYALKNRQDYQSLLYQQQAIQNQLTIARSGYFPNLSANYGFSTSASDPSNLFTQKSYSLGLSLNIPIFSNWNTENSVETASVQVENNNEDLKALELSIKSQVKTAQLNLQTSKQQVDASNAALAASRESWNIETETYKLGAATYIDLQLAYNNYLQAQYNKINTDYNYFIAQYTLLNALGEK
jgi:outer membrane protein